ncbi:MAG: DMT family transporter [Alphaproteobacteria bacterium]|nr:DMT family transporter [Alphaproteobacteria bacterium]
MTTNENAAEPDTPSPLRRMVTNPYLLLALAGLFWSGNHIAGKAAAGYAPPVSMAGIRWLIGAMILWPFVHKHVRNDWPVIKANWRVILFLIVIGGAFFSAIQYQALNYTTALNASIFNSFAPVVIGAAGALLFRDRFSMLQMLGIAISLAGVMSIVSRGDLAVLQAMTFNFGDILLLINMAIWAVYCACLRMLPKMHPLTFTFLLGLLTGILLIPGYVWEFSQGLYFQPAWRTLIVMAYVSIFPAVLAYICWNEGMRQVGAARGGVFLHLIPIYGAILATTLLGEQLMLFHIIGCAMILGGVFLAARK